MLGTIKKRAAVTGYVIACTSTLFVYACGGDDAGGGPATPPDAGLDGMNNVPDGSTNNNNTGDGAADADATMPPTLNDGGVVTVSWLRGNEWGLKVFRQPDGKFVVVSRNDYQSALIVARFTASGLLDATFGVGGYASPFLDRIMYAGYQSTAATMLADGRILLAVLVNRTSTDTKTMALVRLTADGALDPTFGSGSGVVYAMNGEPFRVAVQTDGKIVVAGWVFKGLGGSGVARFSAEGVLDTTFGNQGVVNGTIAIARGMAIDSAGNIVIAGSNLNSTWKIARLLPTGAVDTSFGTQGIASTDIPSPGTANSVTFGPGGTVIATGWSGNSGVITRYTANGAPDTSFDTDGMVGPVAANIFNDVVVQSDGKVLTSRTGLYPTKSKVHRFNVDGSLDATFGTNGAALDGLEASYSLLIDPSGDVVVSGVFQTVPLTVTGAGLALTRLSPTGLPVTTFGTSNGIAKGDGVMSADEDGRAVHVQSDGKILVGGVGATGAVVRFAKDGTVDTIISTPFTINSAVNALTVDSTGRIYAAGGTAVTRLLPTGGVDNTFTKINSSKLGRVHGVVVHPTTGRVVVVGESNTNNTMTIASTDASGANLVESTYAPGTTMTDGGAPTQPTAGAFAIAVQADGHMMLGGWGAGVGTPSAPSKRDAAFVRIDQNLAVDTSWHSTGTAVMDLTPASFENVHAVVALPDGSILGAGVAGDAIVHLTKGNSRPASSVAFVVHLLADGTLDPTFATAGVWSSGLGQNVAGAFGLAVRPDGRILVAATRFNGTRDEGVLVGLTATGAEDASFAPGGMRPFTFGASSRLRAIALEPSGTILATGSAYTGPGAYDLALTRFTP